MNVEKALICLGVLIFLVAMVSLLQSPDEKTAQPVAQLELERGEKPNVTLVSLYDNYRVSPELKTDWGFATLVKTPEETILFDAGGSSEVLLFNMEKLGIEPSSISKVVISHVHADHSGGLEGFLEKNPNVTVFIPDYFPQSIKEMITKKGAKLVEVSSPRKISEFVYTTGVLPGSPPEQSLVVESKKGIIVITGCAHPGIVNIVRKVKELTGSERIYLVVGGFHFPPVSCVEELKRLGVEKVAPSHCTGDAVREAFRKAYGDDFIEYGVGRIVEVR